MWYNDKAFAAQTHRFSCGSGARKVKMSERGYAPTLFEGRNETRGGVPRLVLFKTPKKDAKQLNGKGERRRKLYRQVPNRHGNVKFLFMLHILSVVIGVKFYETHNRKILQNPLICAIISKV